MHAYIVLKRHVSDRVWYPLTLQGTMGSAWSPGLEAAWTQIRDEDWTTEYSILYIQVLLSLTVLHSSCRVLTAVHKPSVGGSQ